MDVSKLNREVSGVGGKLLREDFYEEGYLVTIAPKRKSVSMEQLENFNPTGFKVKSIEYSGNELTYILIPSDIPEFTDFVCSYIEKYIDCYESEFDAFWAAVSVLEQIVESTSDGKLIEDMKLFLKAFVQ